jgi:N6-L-threonylcarbamoyladenine synthase
MTATHTLPLILAIDTSCDDTSAAVTQRYTVLSNVVASQVQLHKEFGGVFPTVAKQAHKENIDAVITLALKRAGVTALQIDAVAVTQGPGLAPALEIGIDKAKQLATKLNVPLISVNHIEGHALSALAEPKRKQGKRKSNKKELQFPLLSVVVSGGHTEFILIKKFGHYERIGFTVDDAAGEALDKFGRMVELGYPAGALIEEFARKGDPKKYPFPLPMTTSGNANLSFSGMKTAARNLTERLKAEAPLTQQVVYDLCASFQYSVIRAITYKLSKVLQITPIFGILLGGGVSCNIALRQAIRTTLRSQENTKHVPLLVPYSKRLCVDNAAMIGVVAGLKFGRKEFTEDPSTVERIPRWRVNELNIPGNA